MGVLAAATNGRNQLIRMPAPEGEPPPDHARFPAFAARTEDSLRIWDELLDAFFDRQAATRLARETNQRAGNRWRPRLSLVLPAGFSADRPACRRDLVAALEVLASVVGQYNVQVVSDAADAGRLFDGVVPFSTGAIASGAASLVVGSRALNEAVSAIRPSRLVSADPCGFRTEASRIVFERAGRLDRWARADGEEVVAAVGDGASAFLDEADDVEGYLDALQALAAGGSRLRVVLSSRADAGFADRARQALAGAANIEVADAPGPGPDGPERFELSNEPIALLTRRDCRLPALLFHKGRFLWADPEALTRPDLYLHRGEEANTATVLGRWVEPGPRRPAGSRRDERPEAASRPLISIIVPVYDRTTELIRLANSVFQQSYPWIEVVFVSNGSPPATLEALRVAEGQLMKHRFRVRLIEIPRACGSATIPRDVGIRAADGELICVLDSDDWIEAGFFDFLSVDGADWRDDTIYYPKKVFRDFGRDMGDEFPWDTPLEGPRAVEAEEMPATLKRLGNLFCNSGVCFPKVMFERAGGIDHRLHYGEDLYLWWRLALAGCRAQMHDGLVSIALHPGNNELNVGDDRRVAEAVALANDLGRGRWR